MATRLMLALSYTESVFDKKVIYREQIADSWSPCKNFPHM